MINTLVLRELILRLFKAFFGAAGALWSVGEIISITFDNTNTRIITILILVLSSIYALSYLLHQLHNISNKTHMISNGNIEIEIKIGDITKAQNCTILVGTNNEYSYDEDRIGESSIQFQIQKRDLSIRNLIATSFVEAKKNSSCIDYGDLVVVNGAELDYHFLVMSSLNNDNIIHSSKKLLLRAFKEYFFHMEDYRIRNNHLVVPLIGTGPSGVMLSKQEVLLMIVKSFVLSRNKDFTNVQKLTIIVHNKDRGHINFIEVHDEIDRIIQDCHVCMHVF